MAINPEEEVWGRDELNLAEFPISLLADRSPEGVFTMTFKDRIKDRSNDEWINRTVTVSGSDSLGLPTASDADVMMVLILHTRQVNNFTSRRVPFSRYELLRLMGWADEGKNYDRIAKSLRRWAHVTLTYDMAWRDRTRKKWTSKVFHIIDEVEFNALAGRRKGDPTEDEVSWYTWSETLFDSIREGNVKKLDLTTYFSLDTAVAKRVYRYLDKHFYKSDTLKFDLDTFAFEKVGLSRKNNIAQVKRKLRSGIAELEKCGFIQTMTEDDRYQKIDKGQWKITFMRNQLRIAPSTIEPPVSIPSTGTERRLIDYGVSDQVAKDLVSQHPQDLIDKQIKVLLWKQQTKPDSVPSPGGFLFKAITENWAIPQGYYDSISMEQKKQQTTNSLDDRSRQRAERRANDKRMSDHWETMTQEQQEAFMVEALEKTSATTKELFKGLTKETPLYRGHMAALRNEHLARTLGLPLPS